MQNLFDIFLPTHSKGLSVDARILQQAIGPDKCKIIPITPRAQLESASTNEFHIELDTKAKTAIFIERLFEHPRLLDYESRVYLANPEWLTNRDKHLARLIITNFWHKSHFGMDLLMKIFPNKQHTYIGFTSLHNSSKAINYNLFCHFSGKSKTRHTQDIINIWLKNPKLPSIKLQAYNCDISLPFWIQNNNLSLFLGFLSEEDYISEYAKNGIHICTSQMEGFGHYINEARSIGALIITLDAPPMNELIDSNSGILVPVERTTKHRHHHGIRFVANPEAIENAILEAWSMPIATRKNLGDIAMNRFLKERTYFLSKVRSLVTRHQKYLDNTFKHNNVDTKKLSSINRELLFSAIYKNDAWGGKANNNVDLFYSGSGSHEPHIISPYIKGIHNFLETFPEKPNVVDLGCGDFHIGSKIRTMCNKYIACDIVTELIEYNRKKYHDLDVDFRHLDIVSDDYPSAEIVFLRQVLQHISNSDVQQVIKKISKNFKYLVLSEHIPTATSFPHNKDKPNGPDIRLKIGSGIVLTSSPFNLQPCKEQILCEVEEYGGMIRTILYTLQN